MKALDTLAKLQALKESKISTDIKSQSLARLRDLEAAREKALEPVHPTAGPGGAPLAGPPQEPTPNQIMDTYEAELINRGRIEDAQKIRQTRTATKMAETQMKAAQYLHRTQGALQASQLIKTGHKAQGVAMIRELDPNFLDAEWLGEGNYLYKTRDNPEGQIIPEKAIIEAGTDAPTQYRAWQAAVRKKEEAAATKAAKLPREIKDKELMSMKLVLQGGVYDDIIPELSDLDNAEMELFTKDLLGRAKELQAKASDRGETLGESDAREMAALSLKSRVKSDPYLGGLVSVQSYKPLERVEGIKGEKEEAPPKKRWTEKDERNIKKFMDQGATREQAESAYEKWLKK